MKSVRGSARMGAVGAALGLVGALLTFSACSDTADSASPFAIGLPDVHSEGGVSGVVALSSQDARAHLARYRHSIVDFWQFSESTSENTDGATFGVDSTLKNDNFAIDADVTVEDDSAYTVASAGVDGDGAAWMVQVENGTVVYSWRDSLPGKWNSYRAGNGFKKNETCNIRVERAEDIVVFFVDGKIVGAFQKDGHGKVSGKLTIGFDMRDSSTCHCNNGRVEQIGVETVDEIEDAPVDSVLVTDTLDALADTSAALLDSVVTDWIAEWNFDDTASVGLDATGNGHNATVGEGSVNAVGGVADFDGKSGMVVSLDSNIRINEFVVEARVKPAKFGTMQNIIVAEPPGRGVDGWQLRIDEGVLTVHLRDAESNFADWSVYPGKEMSLGEWCEIRLERSADSVKLFQNGEITVAAAYAGDLTQMGYDWGIGYDAMQQGFHDRYFIGEMDYIRFGVFRGFTEGALVAKNEWLLAAWEFNEPSFVGLDRMANNSTKYVVGNATVADTTVLLDGKSGLPINLSKAFLRNTFAVEARVKPDVFGEMQNIIAAEPPGRYGDGWIVRLDDGVLTVHFRDSETDGTEWNVLRGKRLSLGEWTKIRVERTADSVIVYQDGSRTAWGSARGDVSQLTYNIGIGYDAVNQLKHDRFFKGEIDYIRYYGL